MIRLCDDRQAVCSVIYGVDGNHYRRDTFEAESRISKVPGTLPVTEGTKLEQQLEIEVAEGDAARPYSVPSRHERRKSS